MKTFIIYLFFVYYALMYHLQIINEFNHQNGDSNRIVIVIRFYFKASDLYIS